MTSAVELRRQVESALAVRFPAALTVRPPVRPELLSCGLAEVDAALGGGLPLGAITELTGAHSSGRTTLALCALAEATRQGESCAYVDASDSLDPVSAAAMRVDLGRLLWVRAGTLAANDLQANDLQNNNLQADKADVAGEFPPFFSPAAPAPEPAAPAHVASLHGMRWQHPRSEALGMDHAVGKLFQRVPREQTDFTPRCSESLRRDPVQAVEFARLSSGTQSFRPQPFRPQTAERPQEKRRGAKTAWKHLDQALQATDLLLNTGGFRVIVLDMGDVAPEQARRVPLATWYRFRLQAEKSRTLFLLMTRVACANSCAAVSLRFGQGTVEWQQSVPRGPRLLTGMSYRVSVERNRTGDPWSRKPPASAGTAWNSTATWSR